ncbi:MAG: hypothetical protein KA190_23785 [Kofleriaceae bacterium]|nr:hypothetical protein [Kofleriaceae bacterium]
MQGARTPATHILLAGVLLGCGGPGRGARSPGPDRPGATNPAGRQGAIHRRGARPAGAGADEPGLLARASTRLTLDLGDPATAGQLPPRPDAGAPTPPGPLDGYEVEADFTPAVRALPYAFGSFADAGAIVGTVRWPSPPSAPATLSTPCGPVANRTLRLDRDHRVAGVVVELTQIRVGRPLAHGQAPLAVGGTIELQPCRLDPPVQILLPAPGTVTLDGGPVSQELDLVSLPTATAPRSEITLDLPAGAQRLAAVRPGLTVVSAPGHVSAWIYASTHPYVTTTDTHGRYWLPDVAPGTYTLVFWHRPVRTTGGGDGRAVMLRRQVTVAPRREVVVDVALPAAVAP